MLAQILGFSQSCTSVFHSLCYMCLQENYVTTMRMLYQALIETCELIEAMEYRLVCSDPLYQFTINVFVSLQLLANTKHKHCTRLT